jgi:hypothetical protein
MRNPKVAGLFIIAVIFLTGCSEPRVSEPLVIPEPTKCIDDPLLIAAVSKVWKTIQNPKEGRVYGEPNGRLNDLRRIIELSDLDAIQNPNGEGSIVSFIYGGGVGSRIEAWRTGWLLLDNVLYPINVEAAQAVGLLMDGYPADVELRAGIVDYPFGFEAFEMDRAFSRNIGARYEEFAKQANSLCE